MKKFLLFFSTKIWMYLTEIPLILLLILTIANINGGSSSFRLYPLAVACGVGIAVIFLYFMRAVTLSKEEVRRHGLFTDRERILLTEGQTIACTLLPHRKFIIEVNGQSDPATGLDWLSSETDEYEINLFRAKAIGTLSSVRRLLRFYGAADGDIDALLQTEGASVERDGFILGITKTPEDRTVLYMKFTKTPGGEV